MSCLTLSHSSKALMQRTNPKPLCTFSFLFLDILLVGMISFQWCHFAHFKLYAGGVSGITGWLKDFQCMPEAVPRQSSMPNLSFCKLVVSTFSARELKHKCRGHHKNGSWQFVGRLVKSALHQQIKFVLDSSCVEPNKVWASLKPNAWFRVLFFLMRGIQVYGPCV